MKKLFSMIALLGVLGLAAPVMAKHCIITDSTFLERTMPP